MRSDLPDVRGLRSLGALGDLVLHLLTFREAAESLHLDGGVVDEHVLAAAIRRDEAVALRVVEPLHGTCRHSGSAFRKRLPRRGLGTTAIQSPGSILGGIRLEDRDPPPPDSRGRTPTSLP